jgi:uncharacterized protein YybS (DUF2232 family)
MIRLVIGPGTFSPILTPLMDAMGTISAPVPVRKASSHVRSSTGVMSLSLTGIWRRWAISMTVLLVMPGRMPAVIGGGWPALPT